MPTGSKRLAVISMGLLTSFIAAWMIGRHLKSLQSPTDKIKAIIKASKYCQLANFVVLHSKGETANYTSRLFRQQNNLFGMKNAKERPQLGYKINNTDFRYYPSQEQSIQDLIMYFDYVKFPVFCASIEDYVRQLKKRNYFEETYSYYLENVLKYA